MNGVEVTTVCADTHHVAESVLRHPRDIHETALVRDVSRRLASGHHDDVRVIDRVLLVLDLDRAGAMDRFGPGLDLEIRAVAVSIRAELAEQDRDRAPLREAAAREMVGDPA